MKKKSLKLRWPYFFGRRIRSTEPSGNMPKLIKPESEWEGAEGVIEDLLRWADDGGRIIENNPALLDKRRKKNNA